MGTKATSMTLEMAIRYAVELHIRASMVNGLIATPQGEREAQLVSGMWVFGSTVKGSLNPNDLDVLIKFESVGELRSWEEVGCYDKECYRRYGYKFPRPSEDLARLWLTKGMRFVSIHRHSEENANFSLGHRVMIYPRLELDLIG